MPIDLTDIISKLNPRQLGAHLKTYANLYLKPIKSWKKAFSQRKEGYDFIILHLIYYTLLVILILQDIYLSIQIVILELIVTLIPILIFIIPFKLCTHLFRIRKTWIKLFWTFLVIKFQFIPPIVFLIIIYKWSNFEPLWIIVENIIMLIWLAFILVIPLIISLKPLQRFTWIVLNYVSFLIAFSAIVLTIEKSDEGEELLQKISIDTPDNEYTGVTLQSSLISDDKYLAVLTDSVSNYYIMRVQFVTPELELEILKNDRNQDIKQWIISDSILSTIDSNYVQEPSKYKIDTDVLQINLATLDSLRNDYNKYFYKDLKMFKAYAESSQYKSNKEYFKLYYEYLSYYERLFTEFKTIEEIINTQKIERTLSLDSTKILVLYQLDSTFIFPRKAELNNLVLKLENRSLKTNFIGKILFFPIFFFMDIFNLY